MCVEFPLAVFCRVTNDFRGVHNGSPLPTNRIFDLLAIICSLLTSGSFRPLNFIVVLQTSDSKWCWAIIVKFRVWFTYIATPLQVIMILSNFTVNNCDSLLRVDDDHGWLINGMSSWISYHKLQLLNWNSSLKRNFPTYGYLQLRYKNKHRINQI